jgi:hypothetical protein
MQWLDRNNKILVTEVKYMNCREFPLHTWMVIAPAEAVSAVVRLVQPKGFWDMKVESISLKHSNLISIPLTFLSESPGELGISDMHIVYDLPDAY